MAFLARFNAVGIARWLGPAASIGLGCGSFNTTADTGRLWGVQAQLLRGRVVLGGSLGRAQLICRAWCILRLALELAAGRGDGACSSGCGSRDREGTVSVVRSGGLWGWLLDGSAVGRLAATGRQADLPHDRAH